MVLGRFGASITVATQRKTKVDREKPARSNKSMYPTTANTMIMRTRIEGGAINVVSVFRSDDLIAFPNVSSSIGFTRKYAPTPNTNPKPIKMQPSTPGYIHGPGSPINWFLNSGALMVCQSIAVPKLQNKTVGKYLFIVPSLDTIRHAHPYLR